MREKKQSIAVLGSGFIGSHLLKSLADKGGYKLKLFAHRNIPDWIKNIDIPVFKGDVLDKNSLRRIIQKGDTVVNLTGQLAGSKKDFYAANVHGARNIADVCGEKKAKKIIHISSIFIYGELGKRKKPFAEKDKPNPTNEYSKVKLMAEKIYEKSAGKNEIKVILLRLANVYGPSGKGIINKIADAARQNKEITLNSGSQTRDFIHVDDVVGAIKKAISYAPTKHFEIFNISSSKGIRLSKVFKYMQSRVPSLKIRRGKPDSSEYRKSIVDNKKAKKLLGFSPKTGLFRGIDLLLRN